MLIADGSRSDLEEAPELRQVAINSASSSALFRNRRHRSRTQLNNGVKNPVSPAVLGNISPYGRRSAVVAPNHTQNRSKRDSVSCPIAKGQEAGPELNSH